MDQINTCGESNWYYDATSFLDSAEIPFGCFCQFTNGFDNTIQVIGNNPYIFVARI